MFTWLHSSSPPQHIANVTEGEVNTPDKLRTIHGLAQRRYRPNLLNAS